MTQSPGPKKGTGYRSPVKKAQKAQKAKRKAGQMERKYPGRAGAAAAKKAGKSQSMKKSSYDPVIGRVKPGRGKKK